MVVGCGGHAKSVIDVLKLSNSYELAGYVKPFSEYICELPTVLCLGTYDDLNSILTHGILNFIVAIGDNRLRRDIFNEIMNIGLSPINAISPNAYVSDSVDLGKGILVMHGAVINPGSTVNDNCIINTNATIDHDCCIGSHSHICPGSVLSGSVTVNEGALLGTGCNIMPNVSIGQWAVCGAGCTVTRDVEQYVTVVGIPARKVGINQ